MALNILQIEKTRKNFYAPAFNVVLLPNKSLVLDLHLEVTSVQVNNILNAADRFSFVINNAFNIATREFLKIGEKTLPELFEFGSPVEIYMGYGDRRKLDLMLAGVITELSTSFPSSRLSSRSAATTTRTVSRRDPGPRALGRTRRTAMPCVGSRTSTG